MQKQVVLVLSDFANLSRIEYGKIIDMTQEKFPNHLVLPRLDERELHFNQESDKIQYEYYLCTIERNTTKDYLFSVKYFNTILKKNQTIIDIGLL
jgi:hypothetical protein